MLPFLEVDHLPSSSSFYSAVIHPLGLCYHSTDDGHFPSITFSDSSRTAPVFQIRQVVSSRDRPLRSSRIVLSAPSAAAADSCYDIALRAANPDARESRPRYPAENYLASSGISAQRRNTSAGGTRVFITDFVGNVLEVVYQPPPEYSSHYASSAARYPKSTGQEASRVLSWKYDVAASSFPGSAAAIGPTSSAPGRTISRRSHTRHPEEDDDDQPHLGVRRSVTAVSSAYEPATSARENSRGLSAGDIAGTPFGVAAGAAGGGAFTYNLSTRDRARSLHQDYDMPPSSRRSTFPEKYEGYSDLKPRHVEVERHTDRAHYQDDYPTYPEYHPPPPEYAARYSQADPLQTTEVSDFYDDDLRGRQRLSRPRMSSARPRSESASYRDPYYTEMETEHRSYMGPRDPRHPPIVQRSYTYDTPDRESYASARSRRSSSTARAPAPETYDAPAYVSSHPRSGSRVTTAAYKVSAAFGSRSRENSYVSARHVPLPDNRVPTYSSAGDVPLPDSRAPTYASAHHVPLSDSRTPAYISARDVPLPTSRSAAYMSARHVPMPAGRNARWETEDDDDDDEDFEDADSIAPSDSISCVGNRRNGR
ncbi:hypothetical protein VTH06DRAFT_5723 [Thermothelomyces fergusii]